jgi:peptide/nickel transport system permease protein
MTVLPATEPSAGSPADPTTEPATRLGPAAPRPVRRSHGPAAMASLVVLATIALATVCAPLLARHDPNAQDLSATLLGPSGDHWLGTDEAGRDLFARLLYGGRASLVAGIEGMLVSAALGIPLGVAGGLFGGKVDAAVVRLLDALMSFPPILLAMLVVTVFGPGLHNAMVAVGIVFAPRLGRVARAATKDVVTESYIDAARLGGCGTLRLARRHVLPNIAGPLIVQATVMVSGAMLAEAGLSFLGLGVQPPSTSWGLLLGRGFRHLDEAPLYALAPGIVIAVVVLTINTLGDAAHGRLWGSQQTHV